ncbi:MAG: hypothetical protein QNJ56_12370 [Gammaproteobacteria bacterium]|nr:hypothetical protein [Gammaproteobacteria bacterium]
MQNLKKVCPSYIILVTVVFLSAGFGAWLYQKNDDELARDFYKQYSRLILKGERAKAKEFHNQILAVGGNEALSETWLPLVQAQPDGYDKLTNYIRLLKGNTEREATYEEIAALLINAPASFKGDIKKQYLQSLNDIPNIKRELLVKYQLLIQD